MDSGGVLRRVRILERCKFRKCISAHCDVKITSAPSRLCYEATGTSRCAVRAHLQSSSSVLPKSSFANVRRSSVRCLWIRVQREVRGGSVKVDASMACYSLAGGSRHGPLSACTRPAVQALQRLSNPFRWLWLLNNRERSSCAFRPWLVSMACEAGYGWKCVYGPLWTVYVRASSSVILWISFRPPRPKVGDIPLFSGMLTTLDCSRLPS